MLTGSHTDSVPTGGHYDGLAGAVAGLVVLAAFRDIGWQPGRDVTAIATRAEESVWFGIPFIGARLALGSLSHDHLDSLRRSDTGKTLAEHMAALGLDADALRREAAPRLSPANACAFLELHIEQGPVLVAEGAQVAIPTTIRGNLRWPGATCRGRYDHSGATPRAHRQDTVLAVAELVRALEAFWTAQEESGVPDTVFTVGKFFTDGAHHAMTKVPGRCDFTLNFGGTSQAFLDACRAEVEARAAEIGARRRVVFELGDCVQRRAGAARRRPSRRAGRSRRRRWRYPTRSFATVGHDAAVFHRAGIPAAMVLVRNAHGSHNPDEAMTLDDFGAGAAVLAAAITQARGLTNARHRGARDVTDVHTGGCLCGGVRYRATGPLRPVIACHCGQCRKTSGHHAAMTSVPLARFALEPTRPWSGSTPRTPPGAASATAAAATCSGSRRARTASRSQPAPWTARPGSPSSATSSPRTPATITTCPRAKGEDACSTSWCAATSCSPTACWKAASSRSATARSQRSARARRRRRRRRSMPQAT